MNDSRSAPASYSRHADLTEALANDGIALQPDLPTHCIGLPQWLLFWCNAAYEPVPLRLFLCCARTQRE